MTARAWALVSKLPDERQYGGNTGYADEHRVLYRYDSTVGNHKQLSVGDFVFLRGSGGAFGVAIIESIKTSDGTKILQRCPECGITGIKARKNAKPVWRCNNKHSFSAPIAETTKVVLYEATFEGAYLDLDQPIAASAIKSAALRPSDQISIEEVSLGRLEASLIKACPKAKALVQQFARGLDPEPGDGNEDAGSPFAGSQTDERLVVLRSILARRGQSRFRSALIDRYGAGCMITSCVLMDLVDAAHVKPYRGEQDNSPLNGLLLRTDLHTMFDLYLLGIDPETFKIHLHPRVIQAGYDHIEGVALRFLSKKRPAVGPLGERWVEFQKRLSSGAKSSVPVKEVA